MPGWPRLSERAMPMIRLDGTIQLGLSPEHGVCIEGLSEQEVGWLRALDGTSDPWHRGRREGLREERMDELLDRLNSAGLLRAAAPLVSRHRVLIEGAHPAGGPLQEMLHRAGIAQAPRLPAHGPIPRYRHAPDLVVLLTSGPAVAADGGRWRARGIPHLPVAFSRASGMTVGPLVGPSGAPCLRCVDLARLEKDPSFSSLAAQSRVEGCGPPERADEPSTTMAVALTARIVLNQLNGQPLPSGLTFEVAAPWPGVRQYRWTRHPNCPSCSPQVAPARTIGA